MFSPHLSNLFDWFRLEMATPREHIEEIRRKKFKIGEEPDPMNEDLHHAVNYLSAELYTKDVHFLMELIQNAEDNEYGEGVKPSLEFVITSRDVTATGASATLLLFNNEKGFCAKNIESICSVGRSTKTGNRKRGYIGEKGIGFKSVFLITSQPYVFSNGYQIRFNEEPCSHCRVGFIVPEWVDDNLILANIKQVYGSGTSLPTTIIVLPLKPDKVVPVKQQLSSIHPELLLFLSKIKSLSVKEDNEDPKLNSVTAISISSETNFVTKKNIDAESFMLHLSANEKGDNLEKECGYHMWRQRFPVKQEIKVERRMDVEELVITLAFPNGQRLNRGMQTPGIYAFLPTEMVTNFPFIIQADFLLASSRETILLDNKWNQGILDCVPSAFISALVSLVKSVEDAPVSSLPRMFEFLPINSSAYPKLNVVRETIKAKLLDENIIPCESFTKQKLFHKPSEVWRLMPAFWIILNKARKEEGVRLHNISSGGRYVLSSSFDRNEYDHILNFLGVQFVEDEWYANCLRLTNLVLGVSEEVYLDILLFLAEKWRTNFQRTNISNIPLLKYVNLNGYVSLYTVNDVSQWNVARVLLCREPYQISWLTDWNKEFRCQVGRCFLPKSTQEAIHKCSKRQTLLEWLSKELKVDVVNVYQYSALLTNPQFNDRKLLITYVHFLYHSLVKNHLSWIEVNHLCCSMPLVDNYGRVTAQRKGVLVPANGSKWASLIGSNPWRDEGFIELGEDYLRSGTFAGVYTPEKQLISFLKSHLGVSDVPDISPPDVFPTMRSPLTKQNTFLLLDWIRNRKRMGVQLPGKFLTSIKEGSWIKISLRGSPGYRPPSQSFLPTSSWGQLLQNESVLVEIPIIDRNFYGDEINGYKEELRAIGVMFEYGEACQFVGKHLMSVVASSTLTRENVVSILKFIKFLKDKYLSAEEFISSIILGKWLKTSLGYRSPVGSVLYDDEWRVASHISDIPFIDRDYYGEEILCFKTELQMLGVVISFGQNYQLVSDHLKSLAHMNARTAESGLFILQCVQLLKSSDKCVQAFKYMKFLKTNMGYMSPVGSYLLDPACGCLLQVFDSFPSIDQNFYGNSIFFYKNGLKQLGVVVDFEEATKAFARTFRLQSAHSSISKDNVLSLLACYRKLQGTTFEFPKELKSCICEVTWIRTRLGDVRAPRDCILFGPDWKSLCPISLLPFIDDTDNYYGKGICEYIEELKSLGVVVALKDGFRFVAAGLSLPLDPSTITPANVYALLECVRNLQQPAHGPLPDSFLKNMGKEWLKTNAGYRSPDKCLLFVSDWCSFLHPKDGPFINEEFYGSKITSYAKELRAIGVTVEVRSGCHLLASHMKFHSKFTTIVRIYSYLMNFNWVPNSGDTRIVWIPNGSVDGLWVKPEECVLSDEENLFGMQLKVLERHYEKKLLDFFSKVLGVKAHPSLDDYCLLWKQWECSGKPLSPLMCRAFWKFVTDNWSLRTEKTLVDNLLKLPVFSASGEILLRERQDVFIADDLQLKDLFEQWPIFVWFPQASSPSLPRFKLLEVYGKIGVRNISECVRKEEFMCVVDGGGQNQGNTRENLIGKGLIRLILGFLAGPTLRMEAENRHEAVKCLLDLTVLETPEPMRICYSLTLSSGENLKAEAKPMIRWDKESKRLFIKKLNRSGGHRSNIEYATYFSEAIARGLLWEKEECIDQLEELIKLGFFLQFDECAIGFLMKTKNLPLFSEDDKFLSSAFSSRFWRLTASIVDFCMHFYSRHF